MFDRKTKRSLVVLVAALLVGLVVFAGAVRAGQGTARADGWTWDQPVSATDGWTWDQPAAIDGWTWDDAVTPS